MGWLVNKFFGDLDWIFNWSKYVVKMFNDGLAHVLRREKTMKNQFYTLSTPSPSLRCCVILPISFGSKGLNLWQWLIAQSSSDSLLAEVFLSCKVNARSSVHSPQFHLIITLIISKQT